MKPISEKTTDLILAAAKKEFLKYGFNDASLRRISLKCNVSTHTIYTRFGDKDGLFKAIVKEVADNIFGSYMDSVDKAYSDNYSAALEQSDSGISGKLKYIYDHLDEARLIFLCSKGSSYEHFIDKFVVQEEKFYKDYIKNYIKPEKEISPFFLHVLSQNSLNLYAEILDHKLTYEEAEDFFTTEVQFTIAGLKEILGLNKA